MAEEDKADAVVIGSGFGGTIATLALAKSGAQVLLLERGQWWIGHEIVSTPKKLQPPPGSPTNMREYLEYNDIPHGFWAHPDNVEGMFNLVSMARRVDPTGLYDFRVISDHVYVFAASGVGGGSLVYSNVTLQPHDSVYRHWPTERVGTGLLPFFDAARGFIGVNPITTIAGLSPLPLERSKLFQDATKTVRSQSPDIATANQTVFPLDLSITDLLSTTFTGPNEPTPTTITHFQNPMETNVCQRQARCNLGCIPGARHTLNKRLYSAVTKDKLPITITPLAEAYRIEFNENDEYPYTVHYHQTIRNKDKKDDVDAKSVKTKKLVVAAGTLGTNELLLKSQKQGLALSSQLGSGFSTDGDLLGYAELSKALDITRGPINTAHAMFKTEGSEFTYSIEDTAISPMVANLFATIFELLSLDKTPRHLQRRIRLFLKTLPRNPVVAFSILFAGNYVKGIEKMLLGIWKDGNISNFLKAKAKDPNAPPDWKTRFFQRLVNWTITDQEQPFASPAERLSKYFVFSCMGLDSGDGQLGLRDGWQTLEQEREFKERLSLSYSLENNGKLFEEMKKTMKLLAREIEKAHNPDRPNPDPKVTLPTWDKTLPFDPSLVVLHPLGGCRMADDIDGGVVNSYGNVFRPNSTDKTATYKDFYVVDGSIIPTPLGVNSSLTISAVAFRCMAEMVGATNLPT